MSCEFCAKNLTNFKVMSKVIDAIKLLALLACTVAFGCEVLYSYFTLQARKTGTNVDILPIGEVEVPSFAVCRHMDQILDLFNHQSHSIKEEFHITVPEMANNISAYQAVEKSDTFLDYSSAFHSFLHSNPNVVTRAVLAERRSYHDYNHEKGSILSLPSENPLDWGVMYHPLYGNCITYSPSNFSGAVKFIKIVIDLNEAYPPRPTKPTMATNASEIDEPERFGMEVGLAPILQTPGDVLAYGLIDTRQTSRRYEQGFGQFMIAVFKKGDFTKTHQFVRVDHTTNEYFTLEMEVFDKKMIRHVQQCESSPKYTEELCLMDCLVDKFIQQFGCIHARLTNYIDISGKNHTNICGYDDLVSHLNDNDPYADPGLVKLRDLYNAFDDSADADKDRCGCSKPCRETRFKVESVKTEKLTERRLRLDGHRYEVENFGLFLFPEKFKVYTYHMLYSGSDFVADIGGYLGLFLGLSVLGLVGLLAKVFDCKTYHKKASDEENIMDDVPVDDLKLDKLNYDLKEVKRVDIHTSEESV